MSSVDSMQLDPSPAGGTLNTPLSRLLEDAAGAEVSLFAGGRRQLGPTCRTCGHGGPAANDAAGACPIVRALAAGETAAWAGRSAECSAGHAVRGHALENNAGAVLVLVPRARTAASALETRLAAVAALWERCDRLIGESEGLAQEVIRSYEQINVIFDITQQICRANDAAGIKHFLIRRIAQSLNCQWACCLSAMEGMLWWSADPALDSEPVMAEIRSRHGRLLWRVCEKRAPVVCNADPAAGIAGDYSLLFGTLGEPSATPDIMIFARRADQPQFIYGDLMMIDSLLSQARHVVSNLGLVERLRTMSLGAVRALVSAIDKKDHYTSGHSERVGFLAQLIGRKMALSPEQLQDLEWGGLLHDVGKIGIHDGILTKPGGLTLDELRKIKEHAVMSYEIVAPIECMASIRDIVLYHHEVPDGTGYPKGLKGEETPLLARIVHVADTFDALTTSRSYRRAFPLARAFAIMRQERGTKLDAAIVDHFLEAFENFRVAQPERYRQLFAHLEDEPA
jgi:HD-GYP domain-containing protein (c-di-GMP phosphodiesterase class II)